VAAHISNTVTSQIFMLREARGWTQKDLAQRAGMAQSRISALEDPNYENFEIGTLKRVASALDVALTVRYIPFSELATWTAELSTDKLLIPDFANDKLPAAPSTTITVHASHSGVYGVGFATGNSAPGGFVTITGRTLSSTPKSAEPVVMGNA
jgi:transcriptional regulator with XRE-family HTH domain